MKAVYKLFAKTEALVLRVIMEGFTTSIFIENSYI